MDADLYDEFGNYIGPELESDEEEEEDDGDLMEREPEQREYDVNYNNFLHSHICHIKVKILGLWLFYDYQCAV